jgi:hypothetical protein
MSVVYWKWQARDGDETVAGAQAVEAPVGPV